MRKGMLAVVACSVVLWTAVLWTATARALDEDTCQSKRVIAAGRYQNCVQRWRSKFNVSSQAKLERCREKYEAVWPTLQALTGTSCDVARFVDNGTTVTDNLTGLIWEKKTDDGSVNDWDNLYSWTLEPTFGGDADLTDEDGTAFTTFLSTLNSGGGFGGANGWRLPTFAELLSILLPPPCPGGTVPCIDNAFGAYTHPSLYWTATTYPNAGGDGPQTNANSVDFAGWPTPFSVSKRADHYTRAVRGGL